MDGHILQYTAFEKKTQPDHAPYMDKYHSWQSDEGFFSSFTIYMKRETILHCSCSAMRPETIHGRCCWAKSVPLWVIDTATADRGVKNTKGLKEVYQMALYTQMYLTNTVTSKFQCFYMISCQNRAKLLKSFFEICHLRDEPENANHEMIVSVNREFKGKFPVAWKPLWWQKVNERALD